MSEPYLTPRARAAICLTRAADARRAAHYRGLRSERAALVCIARDNLRAAAHWREAAKPRRPFYAYAWPCGMGD